MAHDLIDRIDSNGNITTHFLRADGRTLCGLDVTLSQAATQDRPQCARCERSERSPGRATQEAIPADLVVLGRMPEGTTAETVNQLLGARAPKVLHLTEKAVLFHFPKTAEHADRETWLPRSVLRLFGDRLTAPTWIIQEKELGPWVLRTALSPRTRG